MTSSFRESGTKQRIFTAALPVVSRKQPPSPFSMSWRAMLSRRVVLPVPVEPMKYIESQRSSSESKTCLPVFSSMPMTTDLVIGCSPHYQAATSHLVVAKVAHVLHLYIFIVQHDFGT